MRTCKQKNIEKAGPGDDGGNIGRDPAGISCIKGNVPEKDLIHRQTRMNVKHIDHAVLRKPKIQRKKKMGATFDSDAESPEQVSLFSEEDQ